MTTTKIKTIRGPGQRQCLSAASCSPQGAKFEGEKVMKISLLSSAFSHYVALAIWPNMRR
jgi:hypothetical protein